MTMILFCGYSFQENKDGYMNFLLMCHNKAVDRNEIVIIKVLGYHNDCEFLYDRSTELLTYKVLSDAGCLPPLYFR